MTAAGTPTRTSSSGSTTSERKSYVELISGLTWRCTRSTTHADVSRRSAPHNFRLYITAVLPAESDDELDDLITKWRTSRTSLGSPTFPLASRELPVPAQQGLGRDEEATPAPPWKKSAERSKARSVRGPVADAAMELPLEQADLVAKHHQLDVLVRSCPSAGSQHLKNAARDEIAETEAHGR